MPRPYHLSDRVGPSASSATFFTGQKLHQCASPVGLQHTPVNTAVLRRLAAKAVGVVPICVLYYEGLEVDTDLTVCTPIYTPPNHPSVHPKFTQV